ncbi:MAG: hypothetical protein Q8L22_21120 [Reyranella sp.]|nr:hypothetical protein [Reyranella sp.]
MTPFQDYVALGAACICAALLFASTPAQSTKSNTHLYQATASTILARSSKDRVHEADGSGLWCLKFSRSVPDTERNTIGSAGRRKSEKGMQSISTGNCGEFE